MGLFGAAWNSSNREKAYRAIDKLTGEGKDSSRNSPLAPDSAKQHRRQKKLTKAAKSAFRPEIREKAVAKLTDQRTLAGIAKNDEHGTVRDAAARVLTDQALLTEIARMTFTNLLTSAGRGRDAHNSVRMVAAGRLTDKAIAQEVYHDIAKNANNSIARKEAARLLTDKSVLREIEKQEQDHLTYMLVDAFTKKSR